MKVTRIIALALAILTASSLFACSSEDNPEKKDNTSDQSTSAPADYDLPDLETPLVGEEEVGPLLDLGLDMMDTITDISATGLTLWDDGAVENFFDGDDNGTKLGGKELTFPVDVTWRTDASTVVKAYILYTGNDSSEWIGRTPMSWVFYGSNDGENWTAIDTVDESGMEDVDATPYGYIADAPAAYTYYKLSFTSTNGPVADGGMELQLNEMILIGDIEY